MKNIKKITVISVFVLIVGATSLTAFASAGGSSPAEALAKITGKTVENVIATKTEANTTYGALAAEEGKLEEFKAAHLEMKKERLDALVLEGSMTQERADEILESIKENQANCDGSNTQHSRTRFNGSNQGLGMRNHHQSQHKYYGKNTN